jgi:hypothetical protein
MLRSRVVAGLGVCITAVGALHVLAAFFRPKLDPAALWFLSGGLALAYQGGLNILGACESARVPSLRLATAAANLASLAFAVAMARAGGIPQGAGALFMAVLAAAALLSIWPAAPGAAAAPLAPDAGTAAAAGAAAASGRRVRAAAHAGRLLIAIAALHFAFGLWFGRGPLREIVRDGLVDAVDPHRDRQLVFWFLIFSVPCVLLGQLLLFMERRALAPPRSLAFGLLGTAILGALLMPVSGFWLVLVPAALLLRATASPPPAPAAAAPAATPLPSPQPVQAGEPSARGPASAGDRAAPARAGAVRRTGPWRFRGDRPRHQSRYPHRRGRPIRRGAPRAARRRVGPVLSYSARAFCRMESAASPKYLTVSRLHVPERRTFAMYSLSDPSSFVSLLRTPNA